MSKKLLLSKRDHKGPYGKSIVQKYEHFTFYIFIIQKNTDASEDDSEVEEDEDDDNEVYESRGRFVLLNLCLNVCLFP